MFTNGEIVAHGVYGRPSFNILQNHRSAGSELYFNTFNLLTPAKRIRREHLSKSGANFCAPR